MGDKEGSEHSAVFGLTTLNPKGNSSFETERVYGNKYRTTNERADDGADESNVSSRAVERPVLNGIGKIKKIFAVMLQVALKDGSDATKFTLPQTSTAPRTVLKLSIVALALLSIEHLVTDPDIAVGDLLIYLPVLRHLSVDTKTLLEDLSDPLEEASSSGVTTNDCHVRVEQLMISRLNHSSTEHSNHDENATQYSETEQVLILIRQTKIDYYNFCQEEDLFRGPSTPAP